MEIRLVRMDFNVSVALNRYIERRFGALPALCYNGARCGKVKKKSADLGLGSWVQRSFIGIEASVGLICGFVVDFSTEFAICQFSLARIEQR